MAPMTAASKITILRFSLSQYLRFGGNLGEQGDASRWSWPSVRFVSFPDHSHHRFGLAAHNLLRQSRSNCALLLAPCGGRASAVCRQFVAYSGSLSQTDDELRLRELSQLAENCRFRDL
jgi:hypothetical protein